VPRIWVNSTLFLSSYLPLFCLVGVRSIGESNLVVWVCAGFVALAVIGTGAFLRAVGRRNQLSVEIVAVEGRDGDVAAYAATYLLPFVTVFTGAWQDIVSLLGFIVILGVIYVRSRLIYVNPTLSLLGYHLSHVMYRTPHAGDGERDWPRYVISRRTLESGENLTCREVSPDLLFLKGDA
jgi:hypothetical protein